MEIVVENNVTIKELKTMADWHRKQSEKLSRMFKSEFSRSEKDRVENLKEGKASVTLRVIALSFLSNHPYTLSCGRDYLVKNQPCLETLLGEIEHPFCTLKPYYNKYFAHWYYKKNWESIVDEFIAGSKE